jgi:hypothetical protein
MSHPQWLLDALALYRTARHELLAKVGVPLSNRDPLSEFAEVFVAALVGGTCASSRVQAGWDVEALDGVRYQVKYLSNAAGSAVNEHCIRCTPGVDWYPLVLIEDFTVLGALAFPPDLTTVCAALHKKHPRQDLELQFTPANWLAIRDDPGRFSALGMRIWLPPNFAEC